jgi:hypothetical protein
VTFETATFPSAGTALKRKKPQADCLRYAGIGHVVAQSI